MALVLATCTAAAPAYASSGRKKAPFKIASYQIQLLLRDGRVAEFMFNVAGFSCEQAYPAAEEYMLRLNKSLEPIAIRYRCAETRPT